MTVTPLPIRIGVLVSVALMCLWVAFEAANFPQRARIFPQTVALLGLAVALLKIVSLLRSDDQLAERRSDGDGGHDALLTIGEEWRRGLPYIVTLCGYGLAMWLIGFFGASFLFIAIFLRVFGRVSSLRAVVYAGLFVVLLIGVGGILDLETPGGLLRLG